MKLNVYENGKIVKTYSSQEYVLTTGLCEDILSMIDIDKLTAGGLNDTALGMEIIKIVTKSFSKFKPFIQDIFQGLTDDEYRQTAIKEVAGVIIIVVKHTVSELYSISGSKQKN